MGLGVGGAWGEGWVGGAWGEEWVGHGVRSERG